MSQGRNKRDEQLAGILSEVAGDCAEAELIERTIALCADIHNSRQDVKDKLKEKDLALIRLIRSFSAQRERGKDWMLPGLYKLFLTLGVILVGIEETLWELKKLPGRPPWDLPPTPTPGSGSKPRKGHKP